MDTNAIREMTEAGRISSELVSLAFERMASAGGKFDGMTETMAATSWGKWAKLSESVSMLAEKFGVALLPAINNVMDAGQRIVDWLGKLDTSMIANIAKWTAYTTAVIAAVAVAPRIIGAIAGIIKMVQALTTARAVLSAVSGPLGWINLLGAGLLAGGAIYGISTAFDGVSKSVNEATAAVKEHARTKDEIDKQAQAIQAATDAAKQAEEQQKKLASYAAELTKSLRTPWEIMRDEIGQAQEAMNAGVLSLEVYDRAVQKIATTYMDAVAAKVQLEKPFRTGAVTRFTAQGFSASVTGERLTQHMAKMVQLQQATLNEVKALVDKPAVRVRKVTL